MSKKRSKRVVKRAKATPAPRAAVAVATSAKNPVRERVAAMAHITQAVCDDDQKLQSVLKVLRDTDEPTPVRLAALRGAAGGELLRAAIRISAAATISRRCAASAADTDAELRQRVLGILAREKRRLRAAASALEGLE